MMASAPDDVMMLLAVVSFLFLPWLDRSPVKSVRYKGWLSRGALVLPERLRRMSTSRFH